MTTTKKQLPVFFPHGVRFIDAEIDPSRMGVTPCPIKGWRFRRIRTNQWEAVRDDQ